MKPAKPIESLIRIIRGQRVILDADLAGLYGVPTKALNQAVKRNQDRFPEDFHFQLTRKEWNDLKAQDATDTSEVPQDEGVTPNRSQNVTGSQRHRDPRVLPFAFTEHGALQAANMLKSGTAVAMSVYVIRAFIQIREQIATNAAILKRLAEIDQTLLEHNQALQTIWHELQPLLQPPPDPDKPQIGFRVKEDAAPYRTRRQKR